MRIFVNYRRDDSLAATGRINDYLCRRFGADALYRDLESIPLGSDFERNIKNAIAECDAMLVIVGPKWGSARLHDADDLARQEIEAALDRELPIFPLLVENARLPTRDELPTSLHPLLRRNALSVDSGVDFGNHMDRLVAALEPLTRTRCHLRAFNGQYLSAEFGGSFFLLANRPAADTWETFCFEQVGADVTIRVANGRYVSAEPSFAGIVTASSESAREWERWRVVDQGDGKIALRSHHGRYLCAEGGGGHAVLANRYAIGGWETFTRTIVP